MKLEESLQWINSSEVNVSRFWLKSLHEGSTCRIMDHQQYGSSLANSIIETWVVNFPYMFLGSDPTQNQSF